MQINIGIPSRTKMAFKNDLSQQWQIETAKSSKLSMSTHENLKRKFRIQRCFMLSFKIKLEKIEKQMRIDIERL